MVVWTVVDDTASDPADRVVASFVNEDDAVGFARYTHYTVLANQLKGDVTKLEPWDPIKKGIDEYRARRTKRHAFRRPTTLEVGRPGHGVAATVKNGVLEWALLDEIWDRR